MRITCIPTFRSKENVPYTLASWEGEKSSCNLRVWVCEEALSKPTCENSTCHISAHLYICVKSKIVSEHRNYLQNKENVRQRTKILLSRIQFFFAMIRFLKGTVSCYKGLSLVAMSLCAHYKKVTSSKWKGICPKRSIITAIQYKWHNAFRHYYRQKNTTRKANDVHWQL